MTGRERLAEARLYLVAGVRMKTGLLADAVPDLADAGVDLIQLREKEMEAGDLLHLAPSIVDACVESGVPFVLNDRPDVALALGVRAVHLGTNDLPSGTARRILGDDAIIGRSTHSEEDIAVALRSEDPDYVAVGPVFETPTKPGRPAAGLGLLEHAARTLSLPWFAIGGIDEENLHEVLARGARRIVVVRAITEARDPAAAAARLRETLEGMPL